MDLSFYTNFGTSLINQENEISTLQEEISTGQAVTTPDQNPAAFETATLGSDEITALETENTTQATIQTQLGSVNDAYTSVNTLFNNVQSLIEGALNGTTSTENMKALAEQVQSAGQQLQSIGNTTSANGTYLFGGSRGSLAPFQQDPTTGAIVYMGDGGASQAAITPNSDASTIANGEVFVSGLQGNGISNVTASATNTGAGQIIPQGVVNAAQANAFQQGNSAITVTFATDPATGDLAYTATLGGATISTGDLTGQNTTVQLEGSEYEIQGAPAAGDTFTISPARPQSAFQLLQNVYNALDTTGSTPAQVAQTNQVLNESLAGLAQYQQNFVTAQAQNGVTLQAISNASTSNTDQSTQIQQNDQNATAVNMPTALTNLDESLAAVQAAMKTFGDVQSLSLFQYI
jgi:flagellar hook-associated protein 3 FlgL